MDDDLDDPLRGVVVQGWRRCDSCGRWTDHDVCPGRLIDGDLFHRNLESLLGLIQNELDSTEQPLSQRALRRRAKARQTENGPS